MIFQLKTKCRSRSGACRVMQLAATAVAFHIFLYLECRWLGPVQRSGSSRGCCLVTLDCCFTFVAALLQLRDCGLSRALLGAQFLHTLRCAAMTCLFKFHFLMFSRLACSHAIWLAIKRGATVKSQVSFNWPNRSLNLQLDLRNEPVRPIPTSFVLFL